MVICIKCGKEQGRRSQSRCEYDGIEGADPEHAWMDRGEFIDELREKLPPFVKERIAERHKQYAEKQAEFSGRLIPLNKRLNEIQAEYNVYINQGLPRDIEEEKQSVKHSLLHDVILAAIGIISGLFILFIMIFLMIGFEEIDEFVPVIVITTVAAAFFLLCKRVFQFLKAIRYAESQGFADKLAGEWRDKKGIDEFESEIKAMERKWNNWSESWKRIVYSAERALAGNDEELLKYYNQDNKAKNWYIKNIYEGAW